MKRYLSAILSLFLLLGVSVYGATVERFVNTASTAGGDGTTNATAGANRAYTSLSEWEAAEQTDLVTDTDVHLVHCEGTVADTAQLTISGWTTGSSNDITIQVDSDKRHDGKYDTSAYRLEVNDGQHLIGEDYVTFSGVQIHMPVQTSGKWLVYTSGISATNNSIVFDKCILRGADNDSFQLLLFNGFDSDANLVFRNCLFYDAGNHSESSGTKNDFATVAMDNCTFVNCFVGIRGTGTWVERNNLVQGGSFNWASDAGHTRTFCSGSDATADDQGGTGNRINQTFTFVNAGAGDYHLASDDVGARNFGTDLSGTFTDDIDGETRPGESVWDIGADEFFAAVAGHVGSLVNGPLLKSKLRGLVK